MEILQSTRSRKQRGKVLVFFAAATFFIASCDKNIDTVVDSGTTFIPLATGQYIIYHIDSIYFNDFTERSDTFNFQLKEEIGDTFTDLSGNLSFRLNRYTRSDTTPKNTSPWIFKNVWSVTKFKDHFDRVEESFRFTRLKFPVVEGGKWNGNAYNTIDPWVYEYSKVGKKYKLPGVAFDSTATVVEIDDELQISKKYYEEVYAKHIGLVYRKVIDVESQESGSAIPIMQRIKAGVVCEQRYVSHGNN